MTPGTEDAEIPTRTISRLRLSLKDQFRIRAAAIDLYIDMDSCLTSLLNVVMSTWTSWAYCLLHSAQRPHHHGPVWDFDRAMAPRTARL